MTLVAGVDSSTTATKVEVRELDSGRVVARGSAPHPATHPPRSEQPPGAWWRAFESAWCQAGEPGVAAISVAGQQHGLVALDERHAVRKRFLRPHDDRSLEEALLADDGVSAGREHDGQSHGEERASGSHASFLLPMRRAPLVPGTSPRLAGQVQAGAAPVRADPGAQLRRSRRPISIGMLP